MAEITWEKPRSIPVSRGGTQRLPFLVGGMLLVAAVIYLIVIGTANGANYFITIDELVKNPAYAGQTVRISGAVDGDTIDYDESNLILNFTVANIPESTENLALELHNAVLNPTASRISVHLENQVKPDLLQNEAQAIITGKLGKDGVFYASELLLKCPSRYEENVPAQVEQAPSNS